MVVILDEADYDAWLDETSAEPDKLLRLFDASMLSAVA